MEITVKTLDSVNHKFSGIDVSFTVQEFKEFIKETVNIDPNRQRLIFRGKVLQDDKKLQETGADGNVLHLVERPPPEEGSGRTGASGGAGRARGGQRHHHHPHPHRSRTTGQNVFMGSFPLPVSNMSPAEIEATVRRVLDSLGEIGRNATLNFNEAPGGGSVDLRITLRAPNTRAQDSPARARIVMIRNVIRQANHILYHLETDDTVEVAPEPEPSNEDAANVSSNSVDTTQGVVPPGCNEESHEESAGAPVRPPPENHEPQEQPTGPQEPFRHANVNDLADAMDEILRIQDRMRPHVDRYQQMMRNERDFQDNTEEGRRTSRFFNGMQVLMHNIAHIYHTMSDLNIHFCEPTPRILYPQLVGEAAGEPPEAQITLNFQSSNTQEPEEEASGATPSTSVGAAGTSNSQNAPAEQGQRQSFSIPFTQNNGDSGQAQGMMQMEVTPTGIAIRATTVTSAPTPTSQSTDTPSTTSSRPTGAQGGSTASMRSRTQSTPGASNGTGARTGDANNVQSNNPQQNMMTAIMQQMMQGFGQRAATPQNQNVRPPPVNMFGLGQNPARMMHAGGTIPPGILGTGFFPAGGQAAPGGAGRPRMVRMGFGQVPVNANLPQGGIPVRMQFAQQGTLPPGLNIMNMPPQGPRMPGQNSQPIFVGPRPPADFPLYTVDPFLPCASRHFDPRNVARRNRVGEGTIAGSQLPAATQPSSTQGADRNSGTAAHVEQTENEAFEAALRQMLRSVIVNLTNESSGGGRGLDPNEMYNFHPLAGGGGMVAAVPIQVDATLTVAAGPRGPGENANVTPSGGAGNAGGNADATSDEAGAPNQGLDLGSLMRQIMGAMAGGGNMTMADMLRNMGEEMVTGEGIIGEIFRIMAELLTFQNILAVFTGNFGVLNGERNRIRRFVIDNVLNGNDRPSDEDLRSAAQRYSAEDVRMFHNLAEGIGPRTENLQIPETLARCGEMALEDSMKIILREDSDNFGSRLCQRMKQFMTELLFLSCYVCEGGQRDAQTMMDRYMNTMTTMDVDASISGWMTQMSRTHLQNAVNGTNVTEAAIQRYLVYRQPENLQVAQQSEERKSTEKKEEPPAEQVETPMETSPAEEGKEDLMDSLEPGLNEATSLVPDVSELNDNWKRALPSDWVKVIEADVETQKLQLTQPPLSDAYLAGMPPKRRKMMYDKRHKHSINGGNPESSFRSLFRQAVTEVGAQPITGEQTEDVIDGAQVPEAMVTAFTKRVNEGMKERVKRDPDFTKNPSRFSNAENLFKP